jgi:hypothetical protein
MNLNLSKAIANERLDALSKTEADLKAQFHELQKLRGRLLGVGCIGIGRRSNRSGARCGAGRLGGAITR